MAEDCIRNETNKFHNCVNMQFVNYQEMEEYLYVNY